MAKTVYSLVLSEEVVAAIDGLAAQHGWSRSALINHILAEYANLSTPEKRTRNIVEAVEKTSEEHGFRTAVSAGGMLTLRTALRYKYNPAVSYVVELEENPASMGELRVSLRTQNAALQAQLQHFFALWNELEQTNLPQPPPRQPYNCTQQRYVRALRRGTTEKTAEQCGQEIAAYVALLDDCLKTFFDYTTSAQLAQQEASRLYLQGLQSLGEALEL